MSTVLRAAEPPTPQEVTRKLSLHAVTKSPRIPKPLSTGIESDVESINILPDVPPSPFLPMSGAQTPHALHSIAERARAESGEDDSDEDADESVRQWVPPQADAEDVVIKNGYLWKKGERRKSWKKRWFVLRTSHIAYYKTNAEYRLLRLLDLGEVHSCVAVTLKRHEHTFGLISPSRTFYLQASNPTEAQEWITAINEQRDKAFASNRNSVIDSQDPNGASTSQPIPIPRSSSNSIPTATVTASSPGYGVTTSDSDDASISPNRPIGRKRSTSQAMAMPPASGPQGVTFAPTTPKVQTDWDTSKVVISGYLLKCGSKRRNWRKRWFVLTGEKLFYSGTHMDAKAHREIPLVQVIDALEVNLEQHGPRANAPLTSPGVAATSNPMSPPNVPDRDPYGQHTFKIVTTKRTLLLCAPGEEEEIKWLSAVRAVIARRAPPTPSVATALDGPPMLGPGPSPSHVSVHVAAGSSSSGQGSSGLLRGKVRRSSVSGSRASEVQEEQQAPAAADKRY